MDREQFIANVKSTQRAFRRFLVALCCGDAALADDIAQEAYIKAYLSIDSCRNIDSFSAWMYRIGYNTFISHKRRQTATADYDEARHMLSDDSSDSAFRYQELYAALRKIPDRERTAIVLFYLEGYAIKEISQLVDIPEGTVRQHLSRGRNHLRSLLGNNY